MEKLPSLFQVGDAVNVNFPGTGYLNNCIVTKVSFDGSANQRGARYDVDVPFSYYANPDHKGHARIGHTRIHDLREWFLRNPEWAFDGEAEWGQPD